MLSHGAHCPLVPVGAWVLLRPGLCAVHGPPLGLVPVSPRWAHRPRGLKAPMPMMIALGQDDRIGPGSREAWGERSLSTAQRRPRQATCAQRPRMLWLDFKTGQSLRSDGPMNPARPGESALCSGRSTQSTPSHLRSATEHGTDAIGNRALYSSCSSRYWIRSVEVTMPTSFSPSTTGRAWNWFLAKISAASRMLPVALRVMGLFCIRPSMLKV